jgi:hypothetical protein
MTTDIYPAKVRIGHKEWPKARVRVDQTGQRLQLWVSSQMYPHRPTCILDEPIVETPVPFNKWAPIKHRTATFVVGTGAQVDVRALNGCGCGDPLKSLPRWRPESQVDVANREVSV